MAFLIRVRVFFFTYILPKSLESSSRGPISTPKMFIFIGSLVHKAVKKEREREKEVSKIKDSTRCDHKPFSPLSLHNFPTQLYPLPKLGL